MATAILLVDDDVPVRTMLARLLRMQGHEILQADSAAAAYAIMETQRPDLIISDIVMPGDSGIDLRRNVLERWPELPVILISGFSPEGPSEFAAHTPRTIFVQKPFAADQFLALVEETIAGSPPPEP